MLRVFWATLTLLVLAALLGTLSGALAESFWICEIACHFQMQYIVLLAVLSGIFAAGRRFRTAALVGTIATAAFCVQWLPIYFRDLPKPVGRRSIRLLSANLSVERIERQPMFDLITREQPDLLLLFELSRIRQKDLQWIELEYRYSKTMPSPGHSGTGIYSKLPLEEASIMRSGPGINFILKATVLVGDSKLTVYGTHPFAPYTPEEMQLRNGQLAHLGELVGPDAKLTVIAGDFNTTSWAPCFEKLMAATGTRDTRRGFGICPTFPANFWSVRIPIDHCLVSPDLGVVDRRVGPDIDSDHLPILIDLQLSPPSE
jgi:endonuclease/exonuclease/phosphatase (EEP) superfamily protein YafD